MAQNGVVLLVGAGDAIGAAVARRFAKGGWCSSPPHRGKLLQVRRDTSLVQRRLKRLCPLQGASFSARGSRTLAVAGDAQQQRATDDAGPAVTRA